MTHVVVYFKHSKTFTILPITDISDDVEIGYSVTVPYGNGNKYKAVIKFVGTQQECEAQSEELFVSPSNLQPSLTIPVISGSPPPRQVSSIAPESDIILRKLNYIVDEIKLLNDNFQSLQRSVEKISSVVHEQEVKLKTLQRNVSELLARCPKNHSTGGLLIRFHHFRIIVPLETVNKIHFASSSSSAFPRIWLVIYARTKYKRNTLVLFSRWKSIRRGINNYWSNRRRSERNKENVPEYW
uniref:t-SNARE coiled-coil homology domain-containing protein n=1 Tax=Heterorhabditis bacteriophora TaxID=37862 RepID=A0A1I7WER1_HETBA